MTEYYVNRDIAIRFDVFKDGTKTRPDSASVVVYDPDKEFIGRDSAEVSGTEVRYVLPKKNVTKQGKYIFAFNIRIKQLGGYTHVVKAVVQKVIPDKLEPSTQDTFNQYKQIPKE